MPCNDPSHNHQWPTEGVLVVEPCEKFCGFCEGDDAEHEWKHAWFVRRHVRSVHVKRGTHPGITHVSEGWTGHEEGMPRTPKKNNNNKRQSGDEDEDFTSVTPSPKKLRNPTTGSAQKAKRFRSKASLPKKVSDHDSEPITFGEEATDYGGDIFTPASSGGEITPFPFNFDFDEYISTYAGDTISPAQLHTFTPFNEDGSDCGGDTSDNDDYSGCNGMYLVPSMTPGYGGKTAISHYGPGRGKTVIPVIGKDTVRSVFTADNDDEFEASSNESNAASDAISVFDESSSDSGSGNDAESEEDSDTEMIITQPGGITQAIDVEQYAEVSNKTKAAAFRMAVKDLIKQAFNMGLDKDLIEEALAQCCADAAEMAKLNKAFSKLAN